MEYGIQKRIKEVLKSLYPVNDVSMGFYYWCGKLLEKCIRMFAWSGLPDELPQHEIELILMIFGFGGIIKDKEHGYFITSGSLTGITQYQDIFKNFVFSNPIIKGGTFNILTFENRKESNCVLAKNNALKNPLFDMIQRYARQLADIDSSINIFTVNTRATNIDVASDNAVMESVKRVRQKMQLGEYDCVLTDDIFSNLHNLSESVGSDRTTEQLLLCRESILRAFYREIGVKFANNKKERLITDEVESENQLLLINQKDMLENRKLICEDLKKLWGLNVSVEISDEFKPFEPRENSVDFRDENANESEVTENDN